MKISPSVSPTEHWLTLMNCAICKKTPDTSPVYKCNYGHAVCFQCFQHLIAEEAIPVCSICGSEDFTRHDVSDDFLKKLKTKPGIGRPCRYDVKPLPAELPTHVDQELVTVEQLFQLPTQKIQQLFEDCTKEKLNYLKKLSATECLPGKIATIANARRELGKDDIAKEKSIDYLTSRKPLKCPHDNCNKIIGISSFKAHFRYEHFDFKRYKLIRGNELEMILDPKIIQHGRSMCLGIVSLFNRDYDLRSLRSSDDNSYSLGYDCDYGELDSFWLMATGSLTENPSQAYVLIWIFTNNEEVDYNCTLELTSEDNIMTMTTYCKVNKVYESQNSNELARNSNCLYLAYSTVRSMLNFGSNLMFRMTIH